MISTKTLIEQNNEKRELLTKENEKYYDDLLLYIRLQMRLSERQSEEILMELLDHLLDGQKEGKTAIEIFGNDPKGYADEIISQIPQKELRNEVSFYGQIALNLLGWVLMIRGLIYLVIHPFKEVDQSFSLFSFLIIGVVILLYIVFVIWFVFKTIRRSLFKEGVRQPNWKDSIQVGIAGGAGMLIVILVARFLPKMGPSIFFPWYVSLIFGALFWMVSRYMDKKMKANF